MLTSFSNRMLLLPTNMWLGSTHFLGCDIYHIISNILKNILKISSFLPDVCFLPMFHFLGSLGFSGIRVLICSFNNIEVLYQNGFWNAYWFNIIYLSIFYWLLSIWEHFFCLICLYNNLSIYNVFLCKIYRLLGLMRVHNEQSNSFFGPDIRVICLWLFS